jgi:two-component system sensor histidine kinase KdpD
MPSTVPTPYPRSAVVAAGLTAAATALAWAMDGTYSLTGQAMVYLLAVVCASYYLGARESVLTAILGVSTLNYLFVPPRHTFVVENRDYLVTLAALLVVSLSISGIAAALKAQTAQAQRRERRAGELYTLSKTLNEDASGEHLPQRAAEAINSAFGLPCSLLLGPPAALALVAHAPADAPAKPYDHDAARFAVDHRETQGPPFWPHLSAWYVPLAGGDTPSGVVVVDLSGREQSVSDEDRRHLETMVRQVAMALQLARVRREARAAALEAHSESVRNALLASISHDLRTPLSVIVGSASTLTEQRARLSEARQDELLRTIEDEAAQMASTAENILQLARLSSGALALRRDWESLEEIVGTVLGRFRRRGLGRRLRAHVPAGLPLVRADAVLVAQVISNLIDNAVKHSPPDSTIDLQVRKFDTAFEIAVKDRGAGLGEDEATQLFTKFYRGRREAPGGGVGLGLAICKAIVDSHGGHITGRNRRAGGAAFRFTLPCAKDAPPVIEGTQA